MLKAKIISLFLIASLPMAIEMTILDSKSQPNSIAGTPSRPLPLKFSQVGNKKDQKDEKRQIPPTTNPLPIEYQGKPLLIQPSHINQNDNFYQLPESKGQPELNLSKDLEQKRAHQPKITITYRVQKETERDVLRPNMEENKIPKEKALQRENLSDWGKIPVQGNNINELLPKIVKEIQEEELDKMVNPLDNGAMKTFLRTIEKGLPGIASGDKLQILLLNFLIIFQEVFRQLKVKMSEPNTNKPPVKIDQTTLEHVFTQLNNYAAALNQFCGTPEPNLYYCTDHHQSIKPLLDSFEELARINNAPLLNSRTGLESTHKIPDVLKSRIKTQRNSNLPSGIEDTVNYKLILRIKELVKEVLKTDTRKEVKNELPALIKDLEHILNVFPLFKVTLPNKQIIFKGFKEYHATKGINMCLSHLRNLELLNQPHSPAITSIIATLSKLEGNWAVRANHEGDIEWKVGEIFENEPVNTFKEKKTIPRAVPQQLIPTNKESIIKQSTIIMEELSKLSPLAFQSTEYIKKQLQLIIKFANDNGKLLDDITMFETFFKSIWKLLNERAIQKRMISSKPTFFIKWTAINYDSLLIEWNNFVVAFKNKFTKSSIKYGEFTPEFQRFHAGLKETRNRLKPESTFLFENSIASNMEGVNLTKSYPVVSGIKLGLGNLNKSKTIKKYFAHTPNKFFELKINGKTEKIAKRVGVNNNILITYFNWFRTQYDAFQHEFSDFLENDDSKLEIDKSLEKVGFSIRDHPPQIQREEPGRVTISFEMMGLLKKSLIRIENEMVGFLKKSNPKYNQKKVEALHQAIGNLRKWCMGLFFDGNNYNEFNDKNDVSFFYPTCKFFDPINKFSCLHDWKLLEAVRSFLNKEQTYLYEMTLSSPLNGEFPFFFKLASVYNKAAILFDHHMPQRDLLLLFVEILKKITPVRKSIKLSMTVRSKPPIEYMTAEIKKVAELYLALIQYKLRSNYEILDLDSTNNDDSYEIVLQNSVDSFLKHVDGMPYSADYVFDILESSPKLLFELNLKSNNSPLELFTEKAQEKRLTRHRSFTFNPEIDVYSPPSPFNVNPEIQKEGDLNDEDFEFVEPLEENDEKGLTLEKGRPNKNTPEVPDQSDEFIIRWTQYQASKEEDIPDDFIQEDELVGSESKKPDRQFWKILTEQLQTGSSINPQIEDLEKQLQGIHPGTNVGNFPNQAQASKAHGQELGNPQQNNPSQLIKMIPVPMDSITSNPQPNAQVNFSEDQSKRKAGFPNNNNQQPLPSKAKPAGVKGKFSIEDKNELNVIPEVDEFFENQLGTNSPQRKSNNVFQGTSKKTHHSKENPNMNTEGTSPVNHKLSIPGSLYPKNVLTSQQVKNNGPKEPLSNRNSVIKRGEDRKHGGQESKPIFNCNKNVQQIPERFPEFPMSEKFGLDAIKGIDSMRQNVLKKPQSRKIDLSKTVVSPSVNDDYDFGQSTHLNPFRSFDPNFGFKNSVSFQPGQFSKEETKSDSDEIFSENSADKSGLSYIPEIENINKENSQLPLNQKFQVVDFQLFGPGNPNFSNEANKGNNQNPKEKEKSQKKDDVYASFGPKKLSSRTNYEINHQPQKTTGKNPPTMISKSNIRKKIKIVYLIEVLPCKRCSEDKILNPFSKTC